MPEDDQRPEGTGRFPELDELQEEIARRIRDNRRFLETFMDDDFPEGDDSLEEAEEDEFFEEL